MDDYQREKENHYVYVHKDPLNGYKIVYVGMGRRDRAWHCRGSQRREAHSNRDARNQEGTSYSDLADLFSVSTMTMWRALNG
jgi:hypothetical protein